ncbi:MAPEG family protein [Alteromonas oceanisediminis]|uniref:MAPEG family protein n=1 Tax=Alteromonas oceanisediminis TaxID=2836180 RepID=UPI001BDAD484|nr:MAPEG family protein [Alteromonas oceanisediminis]MBT0586987.1 MAPEG family protein [Alteromonas oceanisediminis]
MSPTYFALAGYIAWTMLLLIVLAGYRTVLISSQKRSSLKFANDGSDVPDLGHRITRAQANCAESFVFVGGTLLFAIATGSTVITDGLALIVLAARLGQSIVHMVSTANLAIQVRFVLFLIQLGICGYWLIMLVTKFSQ